MLFKVFNRKYSQKVFNESLKILQRNNAAKNRKFFQLQYLQQEISSRLVDRLYDCKGSFTNLLDLNGGIGTIEPLLELEKIKKCTLIDPSNVLLEKSQKYSEYYKNSIEMDEFEDDEIQHTPIERINTNSFNDLKYFWPNGNHFDAVITSPALHWINDLENLFIDVYDVLTPDGLFIGAMIGGDSLFELRSSFLLANQSENADQETVNLAGHISPMIQLGDIGNLLNNAGFQLTTLDYDEFKIGFPDLVSMLNELSTSGESHTPFSDDLRAPLTRTKIKKVEKIYMTNYGEPLTEEHASKALNKSSLSKTAEKLRKFCHKEPLDIILPMTIQVFYFIGWKPSESTPQPLKRGSAKSSLKDVLK